MAFSDVKEKRRYFFALRRSGKKTTPACPPQKPTVEQLEKQLKSVQGQLNYLYAALKKAPVAGVVARRGSPRPPRTTQQSAHSGPPDSPRSVAPTPASTGSGGTTKLIREVKLSSLESDGLHEVTLPLDLAYPLVEPGNVIQLEDVQTEQEKVDERKFEVRALLEKRREHERECTRLNDLIRQPDSHHAGPATAEKARATWLHELRDHASALELSRVQAGKWEDELNALEAREKVISATKRDQDDKIREFYRLRALDTMPTQSPSRRLWTEIRDAQRNLDFAVAMEHRRRTRKPSSLAAELISKPHKTRSDVARLQELPDQEFLDAKILAGVHPENPRVSNLGCDYDRPLYRKTCSVCKLDFSEPSKAPMYCHGSCTHSRLHNEACAPCGRGDSVGKYEDRFGKPPPADLLAWPEESRRLRREADAALREKHRFRRNLAVCVVCTDPLYKRHNPWIGIACVRPCLHNFKHSEACFECGRR